MAIERCGRTADGDYHTMRGRSIKEHTAPVDGLFLSLPPSVLTIGIGDGGNEVGMGTLGDKAARVVSLSPSVVPCQHLLVATISNWGAYGLTAALSLLSGRPLLPEPRQLEDYLSFLCSLGCRDGVLGRVSPTVDGLPPGQEAACLMRLRAHCAARLQPAYT